MSDVTISFMQKMNFRNQHWHLGPIGVLPEYQGQGIGSRLMQRFCREVDACQASARFR